MILGHDEIRKRLNAGEIFRKDTWVDCSIKEASYALRVAKDGMVVGGRIYEPDGNSYPNSFIEIEPGSIAILSTVEQLNMPGDLVGRLGIRLDYASKGLTGLMGIQVDPFYGRNHSDERLYIKVANFGNEIVKIPPGDRVFNIEFSTVKGAYNPEKPSTWKRIKDSLASQEHIDWTYMTRVQTDAQGIESRVIRDIDGIREGSQSVVMFGVFLVAITILGVMTALILNVKGAPSWVTDVGWIALLVLLFIAVLAIVAFVTIVSIAYWGTIRKHNRKSG